MGYKIQVPRKDGNNEVRTIVLYDLLITVVLQSTLVFNSCVGLSSQIFINAVKLPSVEMLCLLQKKTKNLKQLFLLIFNVMCI